MGHMQIGTSNDLDNPAVIAALKPGECIELDVQSSDGNIPHMKAKICKKKQGKTE